LKRAQGRARALAREGLIRSNRAMQIGALILDMDGVLADTEPLHVSAWDLALQGIPSAETGVAPTAAALRAERVRMTGMSTPEIAEEMVRVFRLAVTTEELLDRKRRIFRTMVNGELTAFPGLREELARWKESPLALATSSARFEAALILDHLGFRGFFDPVITCDDVPRAKPAPDCYLLAADRLGKRPEECVVIEDSAHGITAALDAGMRVLAVSQKAPGSIEGVLGVFPSTVGALKWLRS
jgi:HAD superfamily hydrolase (TIGR01509 family)